MQWWARGCPKELAGCKSQWHVTLNGRSLHLEPSNADPNRKMWAQIAYEGSDPRK